ncbi:MAG: hypothetical protein LPH21_16165 [Shewanella sp.]|nr:hypothetical protein [Shewanella sp.]
MKSMSNSLFFNTKLLLFATLLLFSQAYAESYSGDCGTLHILVAKPIYQKYQVSSDPVVNRGEFKGCMLVDGDSGECVDFAFSQLFLQYGPDIDINFKERDGNKTATIRVQQNYCFLEAGDITVEQKKGVFNFKKFLGNYGDDRPGVVSITSIEAQ